MLVGTLLVRHDRLSFLSRFLFLSSLHRPQQAAFSRLPLRGLSMRIFYFLLSSLSEHGEICFVGFVVRILACAFSSQTYKMSK